MNSRGLTGIVIVVGGMLIALYVVVSILTGLGNVIGATYKYFMPVAMVIGAVAPRMSMYLLILCAGYIDLFKKFMAVDTNLYFMDVFFILGVPPVLLFGICCGITVKVALGHIPLDRRIIVLFSLATFVVMLFSIFSILKTGANLATLKDLSNSAAYYGLLFALPVLFPTVPDIFKLLRFFVLIMIPAAIHGLGHYLFGLMPFEEEYLLSGLSMQMDYILTGEGIYGPFASQGALAGAMTIAATICVLPFLLPKAFMREVKFPKRWLCGLLIILFLTAGIFSLKRFPLVVFPFTVVGFFLIRNRFGTAFAYVGAISSFVALVAFSEAIATRLPDWQDRVFEVVDREKSTQKYLFQLRTLNTRMEDFSHLKRPENWEPFGVRWFKEEYDRGDHGVHSLAVKIFLRFGWVPISFGIMALIPVAWLVHHRLVRRIKSPQQTLFIFTTSLSVSMFLAAALGASFFSTFPIPVVFGMCLAIAVTTGILPARATVARRPLREPEWSPVRPPVVGRA